MLQQAGLYRINDFGISADEKIFAEIELNHLHDIFKGHFPGSPVVPGVCLIQITKEILEKHITFPTFLAQASQVKFLAIVDPTADAVLKIVLEIKEQEGLIKVASTISSAEKIFFKFKGDFKKANE